MPLFSNINIFDYCVISFLEWMLLISFATQILVEEKWIKLTNRQDPFQRLQIGRSALVARRIRHHKRLHQHQFPHGQIMHWIRPCLSRRSRHLQTMVALTQTTICYQSPDRKRQAIPSRKQLHRHTFRIEIWWNRDNANWQNSNNDNKNEWWCQMVWMMVRLMIQS